MRSAGMRVLVTGATGFVGGLLLPRLASAGFAVTALARDPSRVARLDGIRAARGDLADPRALAGVLRAEGPFEAVLHAAVRPHRFTDGIRGVPESSPALARGLVEALGPEGTRVARGVMLSTVCVYGEADRDGPMLPAAATRPPGAYGRGKLEAEALWRGAGWGSWSILRVGPVVAPGRERNAAVRCLVPGTRLRLELRPEPRFSLCSIETLVARVVARLGGAGEGVDNVVDPEPWTASRAAAAFGWNGPRIVLPAALPHAVESLLRAVPGTYGIRCLLAKRFRDTLYA